MPRFTGEHGDKNARVAADIAELAKKCGRTPGQMLAGWVLAKQPQLVPIVGARTREQLRDVLALLEKPALEAIVPLGAVGGDLDSEK